ncbi:hypothetical protein IL306_005395 [Fusarium sp. DS 682]|nr:hypothetical protein IL306_005395 [Fusarium sp. DS 682]
MKGKDQRMDSEFALVELPFPNNLPPDTKRSLGMNRDHDPIIPQEGLDIYEIDVSVRDNTFITLRIYRQTASHDALPLFLYMHGGGYVTGGLETDDATCRFLALKLPIFVASVEYRLAPEHKFPVGFEDSFDVVRWAASPEGQRLYGAPPEDKRLSPLLFDSHEDIAKKAYFAICGWDPRRDEAILLDQLLQEAGLSTKSHIYSGLPHGFWTTCPDLPVSKKWLQDLLDGVRWLLI